MATPMVTRTCITTKVNLMCVDTEEIETLYGMSEADFIAHAMILPSRKKEATTTQTTEE